MKKNNSITMKQAVKGMDVFLWILFSVVAIYVLSLLFIFYFGFINSVKDLDDFWQNKNYFGLPSSEYGWKFSNYIEMLREFEIQVTTAEGVGYVSVFGMLINSLLYSVLMSFCTIATQVMVAYAVAKYDFKGKNILYNTAIIVMIIPIIGSLASEMSFAAALNLKDKFLGVCLIRCKYPGMYFLVFYAAFKNVSWTYAEAAQLDGAGHWRIFLTLMLPMLTSTLLAVFILQFIANFNDYYTPMIFLPNNPTMSYGLYRFRMDYVAQQTKLLAASMFTCVPMLIIFIIFRNKIMGNVNVGGIKG